MILHLLTAKKIRKSILSRNFKTSVFESKVYKDFGAVVVETNVAKGVTTDDMRLVAIIQRKGSCYCNQTVY
jgi:hypothetical protein